MVYTPETLLTEKGLKPRQVVDLKGLMGDASDNYPGVRGIGEKTALKLVQEYDSIEGILENLDQLTPSVRKKLRVIWICCIFHANLLKFTVVYL